MGLILRPLAPDDVAELRRIHETPEVARWWDGPDDKPRPSLAVLQTLLGVKSS